MSDLPISESKDDTSNSRKIKRRKPNAPSVKTLEDLINLSDTMIQTNCYYNNIDNSMLARISPYLKELNKMIGLTDIKQSITNQMLYYLQHLHLESNEFSGIQSSSTQGPPTPQNPQNPVIASLLSEIYSDIPGPRRFTRFSPPSTVAMTRQISVTQLHASRTLLSMSQQGGLSSHNNPSDNAQVSLSESLENKKAIDKLYENGEYLHTVITGPPGAGKTQVAKILSCIYHNLNIFKTKNKPMELKIANRNDFIAKYLGQTADKTRKFLDSCLGSVVFIDEAYSVGHPPDSNGDSYVNEALDTLNEYMSSHKDDICIILAGYEKELDERFFRINPGLRRRFKWHHNIGEYTGEELHKIFLGKVSQGCWKLAEGDAKLIENYIVSNKKQFIFGGGDMEQLFSIAKIQSSIRTFSLADCDRRCIILQDVIDSIPTLVKKRPEKPKYLSMYT